MRKRCNLYFNSFSAMLKQIHTPIQPRQSILVISSQWPNSQTHLHTQQHYHKSPVLLHLHSFNMHQEIAGQVSKTRDSMISEKHSAKHMFFQYPAVLLRTWDKFLDNHFWHLKSFLFSHSQFQDISSKSGKYNEEYLYKQGICDKNPKDQIAIIK